MKALLTLMIGLLGTGVVSAGTALNSCSDPYWSNTLRCEALNYFNPSPMPPPQPVPAPPANANQIRPFTRVDIPDADVRCVDGTRPIIYVDPAVTPSNRWIITMTGGDSCSAEDLDDNGSFESGQDCLDWYIEQNAALMGTANSPSTSHLTDEFGDDGIQSGNPQKNPFFSNYNRLRIQKCSFDRYSGRATHLDVAATVPQGGPTINYDLFNHGQKIVLAALNLLRGQGSGQGLSYTSWRANGAAAETFTETLPSIADAEQVIFIGHSAAGHGLYQNIDRYAEHLRGFVGFDGDVRSVHDAHFMSSVENEAAFDPAQNADPALFNTLFDRRWSGQTTTAGNYNAEPYHNGPNAYFSEDYRAWLENPGDDIGTLTDASCAAAHTPAERWICKDRFHVRLHHQSTAALMREDFTDPNRDHGNEPFGYIQWWGEIAPYTHCMAMMGTTQCPPVVPLAQATQRLTVQFQHFRQGIYTMSELATNADPSADSGTIYVWMPRCGSHGGAYDDEQFYRTSVVQDGVRLSYHDFMRDFALASPNGVFKARVQGVDGAMSECNSMFDGFE